MFINCPFCRALVATDPATDLPPERCPRCAMKLRGEAGAPPAADDARSGVATAIAEVRDGQGLAQDDPVARPAVSIATLLQVGPEAEAQREPAPAPAPAQPEPEPEPKLEPEPEPESESESETDAAAQAADVPGVVQDSGTSDADVPAGTGPAREAGAGPGQDATSRVDVVDTQDGASTTSPAGTGPDPGAVADEDSKPRDAKTSEPVDSDAVVHGVAPAGPTPEPGAAADGDAATLDPAIPAPPADAAERPRRPSARAAPSFARRRPRAADGSGRRWPIPVAIAALSLLLALQWLLADRARLAADPAWRPVVATACAVLRCSLPPWREPSAFTLLERDVRPHPDAGGALRITASFRNDAAWPQPWPEVVLTLSDIDGRPLGVRAFTAAEYLDGAPPSDLVASGQGAVIRMEVLEPGPGAVGFAFDFR